MPMNNPSAVSGAGIFGPYADTTALQAAKPAASNPGSLAYVGASAPYTEYVSSGVAWATVGGGGGSGTVTSVAATVPAFLSITGSPITTAGTLAIAYSGAALPVANGGTGTATPGIVAGANVSVTGTWPNQTVAATGGSPGGSTTQVQFNDAGAFAGASGMAWDKVIGSLIVNNIQVTATGVPSSGYGMNRYTSNTLGLFSQGVGIVQAYPSRFILTNVSSANAIEVQNNVNHSVITGVTATTGTAAPFSNDQAYVTGAVTVGGLLIGSTLNAPVVIISNNAQVAVFNPASLRLGDNNAALPVAQTLTTQGPRGGTDSNVAGVSFRVSAGPSTGTSTPNSIILQSTVVAASGTTAQTQLDTLTVKNGGVGRAAFTFAGLPTTPFTGQECNVTDAMSPTFLGVLVGGGAVYCGARYNGAAWVAF